VSILCSFIQKSVVFAWLHPFKGWEAMYGIENFDKKAGESIVRRSDYNRQFHIQVTQSQQTRAKIQQKPP